ncbi:MFS transporter [Streptomyces marianii]|uniref:MFS transporter n=1 Tax=Streptomyces marianii TaxID=1817406 RepID=A0A5R9E586_9ACTN|nr:MFS transporter [Streptomyces marianii]TLQ45128.1 MFS transporter [Streptomyces marianii]
MASLGTTESVVSPPSRTVLPRSYLCWLAGTRVSLVGDAALYFALGWAASAHGGQMAALVLTAITLPRTVLLLLGGAVGDRFGARRVMITGDVVMLAAVLALAVAARIWGTPSWMLLGFAAVVGTVDAFYLPATGAMPRRLVSKEQLPRAMALQQAGGQVASLLGAPLGAVLVAVAGLSGTALVDAGSFAAVLAVMLWVRPAAEAERSPRMESLLAGIADGVKTAATDPVLRTALLLTAAAAAGLLPAVALLGPLLARSNGWGPGSAGLVAAGQGAGILLAALLAARLGPMRRIGMGTSLGLALAAVGLAGLAAAPATAAAIAAAVVVGAGSGMFACHMGPLVLAGAPGTHLSRVQSLLTLVQSLALVVANNVLGWLADAAGARSAIALCAVLGCVAGVTGLASPSLRGLRQATS